MAENIYFDTVAFREMGKAFERESLNAELRKKIIVSPITLFEVWSQLTITNAEHILKQIQAVRNWTDPQRIGLLSWPDDEIFAVWFQKPAPDEGFTKAMERAFNVCLVADSAEPLREEAGKLKDLLDKTKQKTVEAFTGLLAAARGKPLVEKEFSDAWFRGIARRIKADENSQSMDKIIEKLSAYYEFEEIKLRTALENKDYNPAKHANDLLDAEQLIYLNNPSLCFMTCDKGFQKLTKSAQAGRIITVAPAHLSDVASVEAVLRATTTSH